MGRSRMVLPLLLPTSPSELIGFVGVCPFDLPTLLHLGPVSVYGVLIVQTDHKTTVVVVEVG